MERVSKDEWRVTGVEDERFRRFVSENVQMQKLYNGLFGSLKQSGGRLNKCMGG